MCVVRPPTNPLTPGKMGKKTYHTYRSQLWPAIIMCALFVATLVCPTREIRDEVARQGALHTCARILRAAEKFAQVARRAFALTFV